MNRPYVICHMLTSIDGKTTGEFLNDERALEAIKKYFKIHQDHKYASFACGRATMEESFTKGYYPDLSKFSNDFRPFVDSIIFSSNLKYAICFDRLGKLGWVDNVIHDEDEGYNNAQIIEVLTEKVDQRYLRYLDSKNISYIFAGVDDIDINLALKKLYHHFNISKLLLEGGPTLNASFLKANAIDEVSIVVAPLTASSKDKPLFLESEVKEVELSNYKKLDNGIITYNYYFKKDEYLPLNDSIENQILNYLKVKEKLNNAKNGNRTFRQNSLKFSMSYLDIDLNNQKHKLSDLEYEYITMSDDEIFQPLLINTLVKVLKLTPLMFKNIIDRKYILLKDSNDNKSYITYYEYNNNQEKYDNEYKVFTNTKAVIELLNDVDFSSNEEIFELLRKYNITKQDFFMKQMLLLPDIIYSEERWLSRLLFYKILMRNHRIKAIKRNEVPELILINERRLMHKALFDLCLQLY